MNIVYLCISNIRLIFSVLFFYLFPRKHLIEWNYVNIVEDVGNSCVLLCIWMEFKNFACTSQHTQKT